MMAFASSRCLRYGGLHDLRRKPTTKDLKLIVTRNQEVYLHDEGDVVAALI